MSVDQIVMSSPGIIPQTTGKPTLIRCVGSQLFIEHDTNVKYVTRLEDFTTQSAIEAKKSYESFSASCGIEVTLCRADNRRFSDK